MVGILWLGVALGAGAALAVGPIFVAIVQEAAVRGFGAGLRVSLGATAANAALLLPALACARAIDLVAGAALWVGLLGALVFLQRSGAAARDARRLWRAGGGGSRPAGAAFRLSIVGNLTNPLTWGFWLATGAPALLHARQAGGWGGLALFVAAWFATAVALEAALALAAARAGRALGGRGQACLSGAAAVLFLALAGGLAASVLPHQFGG